MGNRAVLPPSTTSTCPVPKLELWLARYTDHISNATGCSGPPYRVQAIQRASSGPIRRQRIDIFIAQFRADTRYYSLNEKNRSTQINIRHLVPFIGGDVYDAAFPHHSPVINQNIKSAKMRGSLFHYLW